MTARRLPVLALVQEPASNQDLDPSSRTVNLRARQNPVRADGLDSRI
jgi:hypothetical protein